MRLFRVPLFTILTVFILTTSSCKKEASSLVPAGHFRLEATTELDQTCLQSMADSWGILVQDIIRKPVALRLKLWLPCDASVGLSFEGPLPSGWQGGVIDGAIKVCVEGEACLPRC